MPHEDSKMWTNFNNSFTVAFLDKLQKKMILDLPHHLKYVDALPRKN